MWQVNISTSIHEAIWLRGLTHNLNDDYHDNNHFLIRLIRMFIRMFSAYGRVIEQEVIYNDRGSKVT